VRRDNEQDVMALRCECTSPDEAPREAITSGLRAVTKLGGSVELVPLGSLPNDGKVIADARG
jgi:phenylacetate-CoA ligase